MSDAMQLEDVITHGVYVVSQRQWGLKNDVIGVAITLEGARRLVLDAAGFKHTDTGEVADSRDEAVGECFQWYDEYGAWPDEAFQKGTGEMVAVWEASVTNFIVEWRELIHP